MRKMSTSINPAPSILDNYFKILDKQSTPSKSTKDLKALNSS